MATATSDFVRENISLDDLADYLCAPWGHSLALYADGTVSVGEDVGMEIAEDERPIALTKCPGIGNLDMTWYRQGWDCEGMDDEDVIRDCCANGDVDAEWEELVDRLTEEDA